MPDGNSGGYVLIVQPTNGQQGQVTIPTSDATVTGTITASDDNTTLEIKDNDETNEDDEQDEATNNSISVYDFEEGQVANTIVAVPEVINETEMNQSDEILDKSIATTNSISTNNASGTKGTKRTRKSQAGSTGTKKAKTANQAGATGTQPNATNSQYQCNYCNYTSNKRYLLSRHMKSHSEERPHKVCFLFFKLI